MAMKRDRATALLEQVLRNAATIRWPAGVIQAVYVFGSYARGAIEPGDVDVAVTIKRTERWTRHFVDSLSEGTDPYTVLRVALRGRRRNVSFVFDPHEGYDDIPMTLLWKRGESVETAVARLRAIPVDPAAGRAPRDAMLPCFDGIGQWLPRYLRQELVELIDSNVITLDRVHLEDAEVDDEHIRRTIRRRWNSTSPLCRAAHAALAHLDKRGVDLYAVHLHGRDLDRRETPYYVGFELRYFSAALRCFDKHGGVEWIEVAHPTRNGPLVALLVQPADPNRLADRPYNPAGYFN